MANEVDEFEQYREKPAAPTTTGRRGGTARELTTSYGAGKQAPGVKDVTPADWDSIPVAIRGFGQGITAGLIQYPQAAVGMAANAIQGNGGPQNTFKQNLQDIRDDNARMSETNPKAWYGGNIGGALVPAVLTAGASVPEQMAIHGGLGAVSGYTSSEDAGLKEAGTGAAFGAGGAAAGPLLKMGARVAGRAADWIKSQTITGPLAEELGTLVTKAKAGDPAAIAELTRRIPPSSVTPAGRAVAGRNADVSTSIAGKVASDLAEGTNPAAYLKDPSAVVMGKNAFANLAGQTVKTAAGAGAGYAVGEPFGYGKEGAALGGLAGGGMKIGDALGKTGTMLSQKAYLAAGKSGTATNAAVNAAAKVVKTAEDNTPVALRGLGNTAAGRTPEDQFKQYAEDDFEQYRDK